jgi:glucose-6-phosphate dehydrogenase assembly protein OpcA
VAQAVTSVSAIERELDRLRDDQLGDGHGVRTSISNLVIFGASRDLADEAADAVMSMGSNRPSRAIVAYPATDATSVEAETSVYCTRPPDGHGSYVCADLVELRGPIDGQALRQMVTSLLLPDLPVFLVWEAPPDFDRPTFGDLAAESDRLVTNASRHRGTFEALPALTKRHTPLLTDFAWTTVTGWRDALAGLFDLPEHAACLAALESIDIRHAAGSDVQARLVAGWVESRTRRDARCSFEEDAELPYPAGTLLRVTIVADGETFQVERLDADTVIATSPRLPEQRRGLPVPTYPDLLAGELEFLARDDIFTDALGAATDLWR